MDAVATVRHEDLSRVALTLEGHETALPVPIVDTGAGVVFFYVATNIFHLRLASIAPAIAVRTARVLIVSNCKREENDDVSSHCGGLVLRLSHYDVQYSLPPPGYARRIKTMAKIELGVNALGN